MRSTRVRSRPSLTAAGVGATIAAFAALAGPANGAALTPGTVQSFESLSSVPKDWTINAYAPNVSTASIATAGGAADGRRFLRLTSREENHIRLFIPVRVEPDATYLVTARIRSRLGGNVPAAIALDTTDSITSNAMPADGRWRERRLYVKAGRSDQLRIALSLGWFGDTVRGTADFDRVSIRKIPAAPANAPVAQAGSDPAPAPQAPEAAAAEDAEQNQDDGQAADGQDAAAQPAADQEEEEEDKGSPGLLLPLGAFVVLLLAAGGIIVYRGRDEDPSGRPAAPADGGAPGAGGNDGAAATATPADDAPAEDDPSAAGGAAPAEDAPAAGGAAQAEDPSAAGGAASADDASGRPAGTDRPD